MLTRKAVVLAKIQPTINVDPVPVASTNAIICGVPALKPVYEKVERKFANASLSPLGNVHFGELVEVSFDVELKGSGTAGTAPPISPLLRACGMDETISAGVSVGYLPVSTGFEMCTLYVSKDDIQHKILNCMGDVQIVGEAGKYVKATFTMKGTYSAPSDVSIPTATYSSVLPPRLLSAGLTLGGYSPIATKFEIGLKNEISRRDSMNEATGVLGVDITGRTPGGSIDPEVVTLATKDFWAAWSARTDMAFEVTVGASAGNICTISAPKAVIDDIGYGDRQGRLIYELPFMCTYASGDDEIEFVFT